MVVPHSNHFSPLDDFAHITKQTYTPYSVQISVHMAKTEKQATMGNLDSDVFMRTGNSSELQTLSISAEQKHMVKAMRH